MRVPIALLLLLATAALAPAGGVVKLDSPPKPDWQVIQADPVITTLAVAGDKPAKWVLVDEHPAADLRAAADGKSAAFATTIDGQFRVIAIAGDEVHRLRVVKGKPEVMPPNPDVPPKPPAPPPPADPLVKLLQAGYDADPRVIAAKAKGLEDADAKGDLLDMVELYRQAADLADDTTISTAESLIARIREAWEKIQKKKAFKGGLMEVRKTIGNEMAATFPENVPLTAEGRAKAAAMFKRIQLALSEVK